MGAAGGRGGGRFNVAEDIPLFSSKHIWSLTGNSVAQAMASMGSGELYARWRDCKSCSVEVRVRRRFLGGRWVLGLGEGLRSLRGMVSCEARDSAPSGRTPVARTIPNI